MKTSGTILITGSSGLIGGALKRRLDFRCGAVGLDIRGAPEILSDIRTVGDQLDRIDDLAGIVHLAAESRVVRCERNPALCQSVNVNGTQAILKAAMRHRARPFVISASSREIYGEPRRLPVKETDPPDPVNVYGRSKLAGEELVRLARKEGLSAAIVRFSNVYGSADDHADRLLPAFAAAAVHGGQLRLEGADSMFDFTHIDDVADGLLRLIAHMQAGEPVPDALHFVSGKGTTIGDLAQLALRLGKPGTTLLHAPARSFDVHRFIGDPTLAEQVLGWRARIGMEEGMFRLIADFAQLQPLSFATSPH